MSVIGVTEMMIGANVEGEAEEVVITLVQDQKEATEVDLHSTLKTKFMLPDSVGESVRVISKKPLKGMGTSKRWT
jgi:hypothetical protein